VEELTKPIRLTKPIESNVGYSASGSTVITTTKSFSKVQQPSLDKNP
jgi:hypothetical protein